jgi:ABC-type polysaccharide/polyol phosphate export permease
MPALSFLQAGFRFLRRLKERRALIANLVVRDFRQRYVGSSLGWLWAAVHPAVLLASYTFVFSVVLKITPDRGAGTSSFALYVFAGILPWLLFQETVSRSATSIVDYGNLITKTVFPSEVLPLSIFCANLVHHLIGLVVLLAIAAAAVGKMSLALALLPVYLFLLALFTVGVSWTVASLQVFLRDTSQALSIVLTFWFWVTPIFFSLDRLPEQVRIVGRINPLAQVVDAYRRTVLTGQLPAPADLALLAAISAATFVAGGWFFRHTKRAFGDVL